MRSRGLPRLKIILDQDPTTRNLGTIVWDASVILAKYLEKNRTRGVFSRDRVRNKRCLELGSGLGLGGIAFSLLGCMDVTLTDKADMIPRLWSNVQTNLSKAALSGTELEGEQRSVDVRELDWTASSDKFGGFDPPYDFVIAADCIYNEDLVEYFLHTVLGLTDQKSTGEVLIANELRSSSVETCFREAFEKHFSVKKIRRSAFDQKAYHSDVHVLVLKRKCTQS